MARFFPATSLDNKNELNLHMQWYCTFKKFPEKPTSSLLHYVTFRLQHHDNNLCYIAGIFPATALPFIG